MSLVTVELDTIDHQIVYKGGRHIFIGASGDKERWIDTARDDVSYEFRGRTLKVTASEAYLSEKELLGFKA